jgi:hypothetical protein
MKKDYIPDSAQGIVNWTTNYLKEIDAIATRIGWPTDQATSLKTRLTTLKEAAQAVLDKQNDLEAATGQLDQLKLSQVPEIRTDTNNLKTTRGFNEGDGRTLQVLTSTGGEFNSDSYKPPLVANSKQGRVELIVKKNGADSINLYSRIKGQSAFKLIAAKRVRFPFEDNTPPATPGQPEEREYQAIGVLGDDEIGLPSDIVSAIFRP